MANVFDGRIDTTDVLSMPFTDQEWPRYVLREGDILLNEGQSLNLVGRAAMYTGTPPNCAFQNTLVRFQTGPHCDRNFALALFRFFQVAGHFSEIATQTTSIAHLGSGRFGALEVALPPLPEQRKIATILSSVDEAIEGTQAVIDQLQVVKKAMMADLLTRGIPGRHKTFKQTEIGEVPEEWAVARVGDLFETRSGGTPSREVREYWEGNVPWVKTGEIAYRDITKTEESVSHAALDNSAAKLLPKGTLLMAMYGQGATRGRVALLSIEAACNQACLAILPGLKMTTRFLFHIFSSKYDELRRLGHEGTQKNLNAALVREVFVPCPSIGEQSAIGDILDSVESRCESETTQLQALVAVKSALMSVLLTGEVRVKVDEEPAA